MILGLSCFCKGREVLEFFFFYQTPFRYSTFLLFGKMVSLATLGGKNIAPLSTIFCSPPCLHHLAVVQKSVGQECGSKGAYSKFFLLFLILKIFIEETQGQVLSEFEKLITIFLCLCLSI